jgi:hypothetical protein
MSKFAENKNPPNVRFIRKGGRIIPIVGGKKSYKAEKVLKQNIDEMTYEVEAAEAGRRTMNEHGESVSWKSGFPKFFGQNGFRTKKQWTGAIKKQSGKDFDVITSLAADKHNFKVATKQIFDNRLVSFRTIDGKVRPFRAKSQDAYEFYNPKSEEVPF